MAIKSGWLYKTPPNFTNRFLRWKRRHFDLFDNGDLAYSKSSTHDTVLGLIRLSEVEEIIDAEERVNCLYSIALFNPVIKRTLYLRAESRADIDSWCTAIQKHVPRYKDYPIDARPVYKVLPDHVIDSLPTRAGFLQTQRLEVFSKEKFCEMTEGQFRIYSNQSRDQLDLSYSLLPCKGVQDLADVRGKNNTFPFKIEFLNQPTVAILLSAKTPFDRQGWIVSFMRTISILSKHQGSMVTPHLTNPDTSTRLRSISVPPEFIQLPREHLEEQLTQLLGELDIRNNTVSDLQDDKQLLNKKVIHLKYENEHLRRTIINKNVPIQMSRDRDREINTSPFPQAPNSATKQYSRPNTLATGTFPESNLSQLNVYESNSSSSSEDNNYRDCETSIHAKSSVGSGSGRESNLSVTESLSTQLTALCRELDCLERGEYIGTVDNLKQYIYKYNRLIQEKDRDINTLHGQIHEYENTLSDVRGQLAKGTADIEILKIQHESDLDKTRENNEALRNQHKLELDDCREEIQTLRKQHSCEVEATGEKNRKLSENIRQVEGELLKEKELNTAKIARNEALCEEISKLKKLLEEKEITLQSFFNKPPPPKAPFPK
ncbi:hypothetical protein LOD99_13564 [Oopsacas minuta]|uniref:PH domain-containing protein n=1 Tax=Oopsacas minuta TaxID=111878 RepID=A0AAV7KIV3_9METZ|nr:hypothetical protein LOD99_13564 [Oopsacas minuta]